MPGSKSGRESRGEVLAERGVELETDGPLVEPVETDNEGVRKEAGTELREGVRGERARDEETARNVRLR